jgi:serine/threonine-protein kinase
MLITLFLMAAPSRAQNSSESAVAQGLFDAAKQLMSQGNYAEACPKLEESQRLDPSGGTLLNLADCYEHIGRTAAAWSTFLDAATSSHAVGKLEREKIARQRAAALALQVPKMVIRAPAANRIGALEIRRDGVVVGRAQWAIALPLDPGLHDVSASAPGYTSWQTTVTLPRNGSTLTVTVPELERAGTSNAASVATPTNAPVITGAGEVQPPSSPSPVPPESATKGGLGSQRVLALVVGGVGVAGLAAGTVFGLESKSKHDEAHRSCTGNVCIDPQAVPLGDEAIAWGDRATGAFVVGAVGIVAGGVLWLTAGSKSATQVAVGVGSINIRRNF